MLLPVFRIARGLQAYRTAPSPAMAARIGGELVGVIGVENVVAGLVTYAFRLGDAVHRIDEAAAQEMVELMRSRVPHDTGRLFNGIAYRIEGDEITVEATAVNPRGRYDFDYSRAVEFGTEPRRQAVEAAFFDDTTGRGRRRTRRPAQGHAGTPAHPFFWPTAREVLAERRRAIADVIQEDSP